MYGYSQKMPGEQKTGKTNSYYGLNQLVTGQRMLRLNTLFIKLKMYIILKSMLQELLPH